MADLIQWNCRGYYANLRDLRLLIENNNPKCICLQETMLGNKTPQSPKGYTTVYSQPEDPTPGNGLAIAVDNSVSYNHWNLNTTLHAIAVQVQLSRKYTICNIYVKHDETFNEQQMNNLISQLPQPFIITGDFNARSPTWDDESDVRNARGTTVENILLGNINILNTGKPTHFDARTGNHSAIDLTLASSNIADTLSWNICDDLHGSDHYPICIADLNKTNHSVIREPRFITKKADWILFKEKTKLNHTPNPTTTVNDMICIFNKTVTDAALASIPMSSGRLPPRCVPWFDEECKMMKEERKTAKRNYERLKSLHAKIHFSRMRAAAKCLFRRKEKESWAKYINRINKDTPMSIIWNRINKMSGKYQSHRQPCLESQGSIITEPREIAELLADHYEQVSSSNNYRPEFLRTKFRRELENINFESNENFDYNDPITIHELTGVLNQCSDTSPGQDQITYLMLQKMHATTLNYLLQIYNEIWTSNQYPELWKSAIIISFLKPDKPINEPSSYRPIALTSCVAKLLEKIINIRLVNHLENNSLISNIQCGYRKARSTTDAVVTLTSDIQDAFSKNDYQISIFFDLQKAYDTTWRYGILKSVHSIGIRGNMAHYIKNFLSNRKFTTKIKNKQSNQHIQEEGVPQGSVLSCSLFMLAINNIASQLPQYVKAILYVDDLVIYSSSSHLGVLSRRLQCAINQTERWCTNNGFTFSVSKTAALLFSKRPTQENPNLTLYGRNINFKSSTRYLGMIFDTRLNWLEHIKDLKKQCMRKMNILKNISGKSWGSDRITMFRLYEALILSKIDYGCEAYVSAPETTLAKLDPVHHCAIRICTGAFKSSPIPSICAESGKPPLRHRRERLLLQYSLRTKQLPESIASESICRIYEEHPPNRVTPISMKVKTTMEDLNINPNVLPLNMHNLPIWNIPTNTFCNGFKCDTKDNVAPNHLKLLFTHHLHEEHGNTSHIYTDGSKTNNGVACAAHQLNRNIVQILPQQASIFTAELYAILNALKIIEQNNHGEYTIFSDSKSAIDAIKQYNNHNPIITKIFEWLINLFARQRVVTLCWVPSHVGVKGNEEADKLANNGANSGNLPNIVALPYRDYIPQIKQKVQEKWQREWSAVQQNKLRQIKETTKPWPSSNQKNRKNETSLTRLRIGHTLATHGHLMEGNPPPYCQDCIVPLTVKHIIAECPSFSEARRRACSGRLFADPVACMKHMLADDASIELLMRFISEIDYSDKL